MSSRVNTSSEVDDLIAFGTQNGSFVSPSLQFSEISGHGLSGVKGGNDNSSSAQLKISSKIILNKAQAKKFFAEKYPELEVKSSIVKLFLSNLKFETTDSFFAPYVSLLPIGEQTPCSPLVWSSKERTLFEGTNLGNSVELKLLSLMEEWYEAVKDLAVSVEDTKFYRQYFLNNSGHIAKLGYLATNFFYDRIKRVLDYEKGTSSISWTSFEAYLWSHLMITSRAFPDFANEHRNESDVMLVPILDLLNHKFEEKVEWKLESGCFELKNENFDKLKIGDEVFNNYGCKSNEEFILGYGFVPEDNKYDTCALKLKLPEETLLELEAKGLKLPTPRDYSTAKTNAEGANKYSEGLLFFLQDALNNDLVRLFEELSRNEIDEKESITDRMTLRGLTSLQAALEAKLSSCKSVSTEALAEHIEDQYKVTMATIYKTSQIRIFEKAIKLIKKQIKEKLKHLEKKGSVLTLKKILNIDEKFRQSILKVFPNLISQLAGTSGIGYEEEEIILTLWICRCGYKNHYAEYKALNNEFDKAVPPFIFENVLLYKTDLIRQHSQLEKSEMDFADEIREMLQSINKQSTVFDLAEKPNGFGRLDLIIANRVLNLISFGRLAKNEFFIVE